ncbi:DUF4279 domain-containing protein [Labrys sp. KNU-23]|uniref:DUF4279 domain-containing protein n=1 Tax=Labrys sp. KNU-23 TaxID=2789216 RepID=UPI0011ED3563|nr:DUF4279 domain-containing protein [Labrys sp. KNU-23]QEN90937.1 DUF4279 domain-containing protein [Labrys sp. KNU-23]
MSNVVPFGRKKQDDENSQQDMQRFDVQLFIVHPSIEPDEITAAIGLEPTRQHPAGKPRVTPKGTSLPGVYPDTRWRYSERHHVEEQWFASSVEELVDRLLPHKSFLLGLRESGGETCVIVQFLGDGYFGDEVPLRTLAKLVELGLDFGIEVFDVPQN